MLNMVKYLSGSQDLDQLSHGDKYLGFASSLELG